MRRILATKQEGPDGEAIHAAVRSVNKATRQAGGSELRGT